MRKIPIFLRPFQPRSHVATFVMRWARSRSPAISIGKRSLPKTFGGPRGIFAALSPTTAELIIEGMHAAKSFGAVIFFDFDYRARD